MIVVLSMDSFCLALNFLKKKKFKRTNKWLKREAKLVQKEIASVITN